MLENSSAIIALVLIIIFVIIIVVALSWHPATVAVKPEECDDANVLLKSKQNKENNRIIYVFKINLSLYSQHSLALTFLFINTDISDMP